MDVRGKRRNLVLVLYNLTHPDIFDPNGYIQNTTVYRGLGASEGSQTGDRFVSTVTMDFLLMEIITKEAKTANRERDIVEENLEKELQHLRSIWVKSAYKKSDKMWLKMDKEKKRGQSF